MSVQPISENKIIWNLEEEYTKIQWVDIETRSIKSLCKRLTTGKNKQRTHSWKWKFFFSPE